MIIFISFAQIASAISLFPNYLHIVSSSANPNGKPWYEIWKDKQYQAQISPKQILVYLEQDDSTFPDRKFSDSFTGESENSQNVLLYHLL